MKKIFSLLLVCTMIFSLATFSVNAAGEAYSFTAAYVEVGGNEDDGYTKTYSSTENDNTAILYTVDGKTDPVVNRGVIMLGVSANALAGSGHFVLDYDNTKVTPATVKVQSSNGQIRASVYNDINETQFSDGQSMFFDFKSVEGPQGKAKATNAGYTITDSQVALTWMAASSSGGVNADQTFVYLGFLLNDGVTTADFDANTFKVASDISSISNDTITAAAKESYGAMFLKGTEANFGAKDSTLTAAFTYPNSTVGGSTGGEDPGEEPETPDYSATEDEVNSTQDWTSSFKYLTELNGTPNDTAYAGKKVAAFGKAGTALTAENYGIKIGNRFYPGKMNVDEGAYFAIIVINSDNDAAIAGPYTYSIYTGDVATNGESAAEIKAADLTAVVE